MDVNELSYDDKRIREFLIAGASIRSIMRERGVGWRRVKSVQARLKNVPMVSNWRDATGKICCGRETPSAPEPPPRHLNLDWLNKDRVTIGVCSDKHYNSKQCREELIDVMYDDFARSGCSLVLDGGNMVDGYKKKINEFEVLHSGMDEQLQYAAQRHPKVDFPTYFITGSDHEGWWEKQNAPNVGRALQHAFEDAGNKQMIWSGLDVALARIHNSTFRWCHPTGGVAKNYWLKAINLIDGFHSDEKPNWFGIGHYHKMVAGWYRDVFACMMGCMQNQTPFLMRQGSQAHVGYMIQELRFDDNGVLSAVLNKQTRFWDSGYYPPEAERILTP